MNRILVLILSLNFATQNLYCAVEEGTKREQYSENAEKDLGEEKTDPFIFVAFGATGDLTARKLLPAIYHLTYEGCLSQNIAVVGFARRLKTDKEFRLEMGEAIDSYSRTKPKDGSFWNEFEKKLFYHVSDFENDQGYEKLRTLLEKIDQELGTQGNRIFFLAVHPSYFPIIVEKLQSHRLLGKGNDHSKQWCRIILEKPFGSDFDSAVDLQEHLVRHLDESQIYRMDHYLGKEGVQNLLAFRFENSLLEPLWNNRHIDYVQITLAEEIGIGSRASFWEETGSLRDVLQNHLMQLLALVAMEQPTSLQAEAIQKEKLAVLESIRPFPSDAIDEHMVRGQYGPGSIKGTAVPGYREEPGVPATSSAETFIAAKLLIDNSRWQGVPFYIRGGKRMAKQATEILVVFKKQVSSQDGVANALLIRIQPNAGIYLRTSAKVPGMNKKLQSVIFGYKPEAVFSKPSPEAYEKLIFDCAKGDRNLYVNGEEQLAAWRLLTPVLNHWKENPPTDFPNYRSGTWGPEAADRMLQKQGHRWELMED